MRATGWAYRRGGKPGGIQSGGRTFRASSANFLRAPQVAVRQVRQPVRESDALLGRQLLASSSSVRSATSGLSRIRALCRSR
jgi:hypothetical protein